MVYKKIVGNGTQIQSLVEPLQQQYDDVVIRYQSAEDIIFSIPKFGDSVVAIHGRTEPSYNGVAISCNIGDEYISGTNVTNSKNVLYTSIYNGGRSFEYRGLYAVEDGFAFFGKTTYGACYYAGVVLGSNEKYYGFGNTSVSEGTVQLVELNSLVSRYINPNGMPSVTGNILNTNGEFELHKIEIVDTERQTLRDDKGNKVYFKNLFGSLCYQSKDNTVYNEGLLMGESSYTSLTKWTPRSLFLSQEPLEV